MDQKQSMSACVNPQTYTHRHILNVLKYNRRPLKKQDLKKSVIYRTKLKSAKIVSTLSYNTELCNK